MTALPATLAVLADIHGNRWALEAVLADLEERGLGGGPILNLGDSLYGPLDPAGTAELLRTLEGPLIRGNQDRAILHPTPEEAAAPTSRFVAGQLTAAHLSWLATSRPTAAMGEDLFLCHGTPERDDAYLLETVEESGAVVIKPPEALAGALEAVPQSLVLCGHSHVPRAVALPPPGDRAVVNPGSVGLPAYTADAPHPHAMESGTPHARYALLTRREAGWRCEHIAVPYDWRPAARAAERHGRPDWARWLATGRG